MTTLDQLPNEDSTLVEQSSKEESANITEDNKPAEELFEVNGEKLTRDELVNGYMRQSDYTRKTQELAKIRKEKEDNLSDEEKAVDDFLKQRGYVTKDELARKEKLDTILAGMPELKDQKQAIEHIYDTSNLSYEDILTKFKFISSDKLGKAKQRGFKGNSNRNVREKPIAEYSHSEYEAWRAKQGFDTGSKFF